MNNDLPDLVNNEGGSEPIYARIKGFVQKRIDTGAWPAGYCLPSEPEFARRLGVSRMTVNRAMRDLAVDGLIIRIPGVGTFVEKPAVKSTFLEIRNIRDEIEARNHAYSCEICRLQRESADAATAERMEMQRGSKVLHSIIIHHENGNPIQLEDRYVNPEFAPDYLLQDFTRTTPNQYLMSLGPLDEIEHIIRSTPSDEMTRELLAMEPGETVLSLKRRTWSRNMLVTSADLAHPGSRFSLEGRFKTRRS